MLDDPFLPWEEQEAVATNLMAELHKFTDREESGQRIDGNLGAYTFRKDAGAGMGYRPTSRGGVLEIRIRSDPDLLSDWILNFQHLFQIRIRT